ncbi:ovalbumin-related protein X-like isoform X2 [Hyalella azteca]|uniref:Ovalbumin-related protein X-like isoform X2 n=1 Tax=Hyalella azteca TaxID=294128 RepID=A0A8B7PDL0_HYAAZ|nr:ovalbumin-related protein X-like isoform X2 [Hyalella azteca]
MVAWRVVLVVATLMSSATCTLDSCFPDSGSSDTTSSNFNFSGVDIFGLGLFRELNSLMTSSQSAGDANLLVSPYSVWSALSLALMGAEGRSRRQLEDALGLPTTRRGAYRTKYALDFVMRALGSGTNGGPELRRVDRAYFDPTVQLHPCVTNLLNDVQILDMIFDSIGSANKINNDVSMVTGGQIKDLLSSDALVNSLFVLLNAIYFKGSWQTKFDPKNTSKQKFNRQSGEMVAMADMMTVESTFNLAASTSLGAAMLQLPYYNSNMSMLVMLPDPSSTVDETLKQLSPTTLSQSLAALKPTIVRVSLPKFDLAKKMEDELVQGLGRLGITDIFNSSVANFTSFTSDSSLYVDTAIHQAKVMVNEEGTVAAAATALTATRSGSSNPVQFSANRPFLFLIYDSRVRVTLFAGIIRNPSK